MGASREGFNLFTKSGWYNLSLRFKYKSYKLNWKYIFADTFLQIWCWIVGHRSYNAGYNDNAEWACNRCGQWLQQKELTTLLTRSDRYGRM